MTKQPDEICRLRWMALCRGLNGEPFIRETGGGVFVVAVTDRDEVLFIIEPTVIDGTPVLWLPAGAIGTGESPVDAANRELQEEAGYKAARLDLLSELRPLARHGDWHVHAVLARGLTPSRLPGDERHLITVEAVPMAGFERLIDAGRLLDSTCIAALFLARRFLANERQRASNAEERLRVNRCQPKGGGSALPLDASSIGRQPACRPAEPGDIAGVLAVDEASAPVDATGAVELRVLADPAALEFFLGCGGLLVAEIDGKVAGYALTCLITRMHGGGPLAWVEHIGVHPEFRRQGIGSALLEFARSHYRGKAACLHASVHPANAASLGLFRRLGAEEAERVLFYKDAEVPLT